MMQIILKKLIWIRQSQALTLAHIYFISELANSYNCN